MSYHSSMEWDFDQEVTTELIDELVTALKANKEYRGGDGYVITYYVGTMIDAIVFSLALFLDDELYKSEDDLHWLIDNAPDKAKARKIAYNVVKELGLDPG